MKLIERIKLLHRANKYKNKDDKGGIAYINSAVKEGNVVFDIGAHKAGYMYFFQQQVGMKGHVYGFEPQSSLYHYLVKIKRLFNWDNVTIEHLALSDQKASVPLFIPENKVSRQSSPGATIVDHNDRSARTETVSTESLDEYCTRHKFQPDFLKIDVEGNELKVLQGGLSTINASKPKMIIEIESRHVGEEKVTETFHFLQSLGYEGFMVHGLNRISLKEFSFSKYQDVNDPINYCNNFIFEMP